MMFLSPIYDSYILSEWWGSIKSSSVACPNKAGTKQHFATCKVTFPAVNTYLFAIKSETEIMGCEMIHYEDTPFFGDDTIPYACDGGGGDGSTHFIPQSKTRRLG